MEKLFELEFLKDYNEVLKIVGGLLQDKYKIIPESLNLIVKNKEKIDYYSKSWAITTRIREVEDFKITKIAGDFTLKGVSKESLIWIYNQDGRFFEVSNEVPSDIGENSQVIDGNLVTFNKFKIKKISDNFILGCDLAEYLSIITSYMELRGYTIINGEFKDLQKKTEEFLLNVFLKYVEISF